jgi:hypothetical protein
MVRSPDVADSRIRLQPRNADIFIAREVYVGWDNVLQTYYAHVIDGDDDHGEERRTVDLGGDIAEITHPGRAIDAVRPYADIPDDLGDLLTISLVSTTAAVSDLRTESEMDQHQQNLEAGRTTPFRLNGFVTSPIHEDVGPLLAERGWTSVDVHEAERSRIETYRRGDHDLVIGWGQVGEDYPEHLVSPIRIDGHRHSLMYERRLEDFLDDLGPDPETMSFRGDDSLDGLTDEIVSGREDTRAVDGQRRVDELEQMWVEDPPAEGDGFHSGLGT